MHTFLLLDIALGWRSRLRCSYAPPVTPFYPHRAPQTPFPKHGTTVQRTCAVRVRAPNSLPAPLPLSPSPSPIPITHPYHHPDPSRTLVQGETLPGKGKRQFTELIQVPPHNPFAKHPRGHGVAERGGGWQSVAERGWAERGRAWRGRPVQVVVCVGSL